MDELELQFGLKQLDAPRVLSSFNGTNGVGRSGFYDGKLLLCAGILLPWHGVGIAWALLSQGARQHPLFVHREVIRGFAYFKARFRLRRIEANVDVANAQAVRWAKRLGFKEESVMHKYGPSGETYMKMVVLP